MSDVLGLENDSTVPNYPTMAEALAWLRHNRIPHRQTTPHQIKIGQQIQWWPVKGTIFVDREAKTRPKKGRQALVNLLHELKDTL